MFYGTYSSGNNATQKETKTEESSKGTTIYVDTSSHSRYPPASKEYTSYPNYPPLAAAPEEEDDDENSAEEIEEEDEDPRIYYWSAVNDDEEEDDGDDAIDKEVVDDDKSFYSHP